MSGSGASEPNGSNLPHLIDQAAQATPGGALASPLNIFVGRLVKSTGSDADAVLRTLKKMALDQTLPKLTDLAFRLARLIGERPEYDRRLTDLLRAAEALIELATKAGETTPDAVTSDYVAYACDPEAEVVRKTIEGKCLTPAGIRACIDSAMELEAELKTADVVSVTDLPADVGRAERKMLRGEITSLSLAAMKDSRASFEYTMARRLARSGSTKANQDYAHLLALIRNEAAEAHDVASLDGEPYGTRMLMDLRERLRRIATEEPATARHLSQQQLLGVLTILSERCDVWWSPAFDVDAEVAA